MEALDPCFSSSTTMGNEPEPRSIAQPIAYRGEAEEAVGIHPLAECHYEFRLLHVQIKRLLAWRSFVYSFSCLDALTLRQDKQNICLF
jgi:hypothetical protein